MIQMKTEKHKCSKCGHETEIEVMKVPPGTKEYHIRFNCGNKECNAMNKVIKVID